MIQLKPSPSTNFTCPECGSTNAVLTNVIVESVHILGDCKCPACGLDFYQVFPIGHTVDAVLSIGKANGMLYQPDTHPTWLSESVLKAHRGMRKEVVSIRKIVYKKCENVVILNTLDFLYGHTLLKLYNALYHLDHQKDLGLILIIPKMFEWLIPQGCAEAWVVDLKLSELAYGYESIQNFVSQEFDRFQKIYLSKAYSHPDFTNVDITRLTKVKPFDLATFSQQKPTITFVLREDRLWFRSLPDYWLYRVFRKLKTLSWGRRILSTRQNQLIKKTILEIRKKLPEANVYVVGLGTTGNFKGFAIDQRKTQVDPAVETLWCNIYSQSHVVVGVHGSNMLLPTALAAGCVEILPEDRFSNIIQDISVRYASRLQLFFYRFVDQFSNPKAVANKVVAMVLDYDLYHKNMCCNIYQDTLRSEPTKEPEMTIMRHRDDARH